MALKSSSRNGARIRVVVLHTAEGSRTKESLYNFFSGGVNASSHVGIDAGGVADWIHRSRAAWTLRNGNPYSVNAELCAFAGFTRAEWLSTGTVRGCQNPRAIVRNAAAWAKRECEVLGIPKRLLTVAEFRAGESGIMDHDTYSDATGDGNHWDIGEAFPWPEFFKDMGAVSVPTLPKKDGFLMALSDAQQKTLYDRIWEIHKVWDKGGDPQAGEYTRYLVDILRRVRTMDARQAGMDAALKQLAQKVAENDGQDPDELYAVVRRAVDDSIEEGTLDVNIDLTGVQPQE